MRVVVVVPHMDDETIGCGGTICKHKANSDEVYCVFVANRIYKHVLDPKMNDMQKEHTLKAKNILGYDETIFLDLNDERLDYCLQDIIIPLEKHIEKIKPETVYLPFRGDNNQDHRAVFDASRVIIRPAATPYIKEIYMYEVPSSTEQTPPFVDFIFSPNFYVDITNYIDKKIKALNCYETEKRTFPHPRSENAVRIHSQKRGTEIGFEYAEAFMLIRSKWE